MCNVTSKFEGGVKIGGERKNKMRFADGTTLAYSSKEEHFVVDGEKIEVVEEIVYLGSTVTKVPVARKSEGG